MKAYLSLPISGTDDYHERAFDAEMNIRNQFDVNRIVNPVYVRRPVLWMVKYLYLKLLKENRKIWLHYMRDDVKHLFYCTDIFLCQGWELSAGCNLEYKIAFELGLRIWFESGGGWKC